MQGFSSKADPLRICYNQFNIVSFALVAGSEGGEVGRRNPSSRCFLVSMGAVLLLSLNSPTTESATDQMIVKGRCRMGGCGFTKILSVHESARSHRGTLNEVLAQNDFVDVPMLNDEPQWDQMGAPMFPDPPATSWVFCSFALPAVVYVFSDGQDYVVDVISPGYEYFGYNTVSHLIYWRVCHGVTLDEGTLADDSVSTRAKQLGYRSLGDRATQQRFQNMRQVRRFLGV